MILWQLLTRLSTILDLTNTGYVHFIQQITTAAFRKSILVKESARCYCPSTSAARSLDN